MRIIRLREELCFVVSPRVQSRILTNLPVNTAVPPELFDEFRALRLRGDKQQAVAVQWALICLTLLLGVMDVRIGGGADRVARLML